MFQSLFLWIFRSYDSKRIELSAINNCVSILVLMDLSFLRVELVQELMLHTAFQSLFLWIFRSYFKVDGNFSRLMAEFQSLFLWIFRSYLGITDEELGEMIVSILVLMDLSFLQIAREILESLGYDVSILVLMDLSFLHKSGRNNADLKARVSILVLMDLSFLRKTYLSYTT